MMKKILFFIPFLVVVFSAYFLLNNRFKNELKFLEEESIRINNELNLIYNNMGIQFNSEDWMLNRGTKVLSIKGDTLLLPEILRESQKVLFFRFSKSFCQICVEQEIKNLNNLIENNSSLKIIGLTDFREAGSFKNYPKLKSLKFDIYDLIDDLNIPVEDLMIPYIFISNLTEMKASMLFIPSKDLPENSTRYYRIIEERLQNSF